MTLCELCHTPVAGQPRKHLKSRAHRAALASPAPAPPLLPRARRTAPCPHCLSAHASPAPRCAPPPHVRRPADLSAPFVTGAPPPPAPLPAPVGLDAVVTWGCRAGAWRRPPNVDVDAAAPTPEAGFAGTAEALRAADARARAGDPAAGIWVSFDADGDLVHPAWFVAGGGARLVPTYANVLVTLGGGMSIGLHVDTDNGPAARVPPVKVCTYLHLVQGSKRVVLVPPGCKDVARYRDVWVGGPPLRRAAAEGDDGADDEEDEEATVALVAARELLVRDGGFYFRLRERQVLLVPHGWHHWLIADPGLSVTLSGSRY